MPRKTYEDTELYHNPKRLVGVTCNIFSPPVGDRKFLGSADVEKLLSFDEDTFIGEYRVKFAAKGEVRNQQIFLGKKQKSVVTEAAADDE